MKVTGTDGKEYTIEPRADLSGANLTDANLISASLADANLYRAYLIRADLTDVCLSGADLTNANLSGAVWNDGTVFPEGFEIPDELRG